MSKYDYTDDTWLGWVGLEVEELKCYTADFETTTDIDDCRVWAWMACDTDDIEHTEYGNTLQTFIEWCDKHANCKVYFHNLGFDGYFIIDWLLNHNWLWCDGKPAWHHFKTLISDMNQVYAIELYFSEKHYVKIYDSLKIIPLSIASMAKAYGMEEGKGELDYSEKREIGHELTDEELDYIRRDVQIAAIALKQHFDAGLTRMTAGSNALQDYKKMCGGHKEFRRKFPALDYLEDEFIRQAYRGGFTYCSPRFKYELLGEGCVYDTNSMYPSVMAGCEGEILPYGKPKWFEGEPPEDDTRPLWVASVTTSFKLKPEHVPCLQIKNNWRFAPTQYLEDSNGEVTIITSSVDWELIKRQYDVEYYTFNGGYNFRASSEMFRDYVMKWTAIKIEAGKTGNKGRRQEAKLQLNSLYGKFATRTKVRSRKPELDENGIVRYVDLEPEERDPVYLPVGVFITAWARWKIVNAAQSVYDRFIYADTDSLHLIGREPVDSIEVDDYELGKWARESEFDRARFLGAKCYAEEENGELTVHVAGMPSRCHKEVTLENFHIGSRS